MFISRILYPVEVLGPGKRIGIWMSGCIHRCPGCSNPELWEQSEDTRTDIETVMRLVNHLVQQGKPDGFTITGGDPFFQPDALRVLLPRLEAISEDILVYTGYQYEELPADILKHIAVLIDGKYIEERNFAEALRGSDNQRICFLKGKYAASYGKLLRSGSSRIQNFPVRGGVISVGIHRPDYERELKETVEKKGLTEKND